MRLFLRASGAFSLLVISTMAHGSSFAIREQSAHYQGTSYAGATASKEVDTMFFNPASIGFVDRPAIALNAAYISIPSKAKNIDARRAGGAIHSGGSSTKGFMEEGRIPSLAMSVPLNEKFAMGLTINSPFALQTSYSQNWAGRYHGTDSEVHTISINPVLAYKPVPTLSLAVGPQFEYGYASLSNAIDQTLLSGGVVPSDAYGTVEGHDWQIGYTAGILWDVIPEKTTLGLSYRSKMEHSLKGKSHFSGVAAPIASTYNLVNGGVKANMNLPAMASFGVSHKLNDKLTLLSDITWTQWSKFKEIRVRYDTGQADSVSTTNWDDTWFYSLGGEYKINDKFTLRAGGAIDETPTNDQYRTVRIPDSKRYWASFGAGYDISEKVTIDAAYSHIFMDDTNVNLTATGENLSRGSFSANYENSIDIVMLSAKMKF